VKWKERAPKEREKRERLGTKARGERDGKRRGAVDAVRRK